MKRLLFSIIIAIAVLDANAQLLKENKQLLADGSVANFVTQADILSGLFKVYRNTADNEIVRGSYVNGSRKGNWYYFNFDNSLFVRYNFDVNKLVYADYKSLSNFDVYVDADESIKGKVSIPIPLWSFDSFYLIATESAINAIDGPHKKYLKQKELKIRVRVDKSGGAKYYVQYRVEDEDFEREFVVGNKFFDISWLPASLDGRNYSADIFFLTKFIDDLSDKNSGHRRFNWSNR